MAKNISKLDNSLQANILSQPYIIESLNYCTNLKTQQPTKVGRVEKYHRCRQCRQYSSHWRVPCTIVCVFVCMFAYLCQSTGVRQRHAFRLETEKKAVVSPLLPTTHTSDIIFCSRKFIKKIDYFFETPRTILFAFLLMHILSKCRF